MSMKAEWWEDFFAEPYLTFQPVMLSGEQTRAEADFIQRVLRPGHGSKVLDVPCGHGRHSLELASRGHSVTGVDLSEHLLNDARLKARERQLEVVWERLDMRALKWVEEFDGAFSFGSSIGFFDEEGNMAFLRGVARALKPEARFVIATHHVAEVCLRGAPGRSWWQFGDTLLLQEWSYDHERSRAEFEWQWMRHNKTEKKSGSIRVYPYRELCHLIESAGFSGLEGYGSLKGEPFKLGASSLYLVAEKKAD